MKKRLPVFCLVLSMMLGVCGCAGAPAQSGEEASSGTDGMLTLNDDCSVTTAACYANDKSKKAYKLPKSAFQTGDLMVSPKGDDGADGSKKHPLKTVSEAKRRLAQLGGTDPVTVWIREGTYEETLSFTKEDRPNVTYAAWKGEEVRIAGSHLVTNWEETRVNGKTVWVADMTGYEVSALTKNGTSLSTPTWAENWITAEEGINVTAAGGVCRCAAGSLSDAPELTGAWVHNVNKTYGWKDEWATVTGMTREEDSFAFARPEGEDESLWMNPNWLSGDILTFANVISLLGEKEGQWCFDAATDKLYYVPEAGETREKTELYASVRENLVTVDGTDGISFTGITFCETGWHFANSIQGANALPCIAFLIRDAKNTNVLGCYFENLGGHGIQILGGVKEFTVEGCRFRNIGASALYLAGADCADVSDPRLTEQVTFRDNLVEYYGEHYYQACGVIVQYARHVDISDNEIHEGYYTGVSIGWHWGYTVDYKEEAYATTTGPNTNFYDHQITDYITVSDNLIYNIGRDMIFHDGGGIYSLGIQPHSKETGNVIFNINLNWGLYLDEGSTGITLENNLVFRCRSYAMFCHYGRENIIRNNIFAFCTDDKVVASAQNWCRTVQMTKFIPTMILTDNILLLNEGIFPQPAEGKANFTMEQNTVFCYQLGVIPEEEKGAYMLSEDTVYTDPCFTDPANYDFTFRKGAPLKKMNFTPWDYREAGTVSRLA